MTARLSPQRETETVAGADELLAKCRRRGRASLADVEWLKNDVHDLAVELAAVRAERDEVTKRAIRAIHALKSPVPEGSAHYQSGWDTGLEAAMDAVRDVAEEAFR